MSLNTAIGYLLLLTNALAELVEAVDHDAAHGENQGSGAEARSRQVALSEAGCVSHGNSWRGHCSLCDLKGGGWCESAVVCTWEPSSPWLPSQLRAGPGSRGLATMPTRRAAISPAYRRDIHAFEAQPEPMVAGDRITDLVLHGAVAPDGGHVLRHIGRASRVSDSGVQEFL